jgi:hypothetical protein
MWLVLSLVGFALAVVLHAVFARMGGSLTIVLSFLSVSIPVAAVLAAVALRMFAISDESIAAVLVYLALCETYIFLFTLAANGVSVSLMMRLRSRPTSVDELMKSYSTRAMVERRIGHLKSGGFLIEEDGQIALLERGKALVRAFALARGFFKHRRSLDIGVADHGESGQRSRP